MGVTSGLRIFEGLGDHFLSGEMPEHGYSSSGVACKTSFRPLMAHVMVLYVSRWSASSPNGRNECRTNLAWSVYVICHGSGAIGTSPNPMSWLLKAISLDLSANIMIFSAMGRLCRRVLIPVVSEEDELSSWRGVQA